MNETEFNSLSFMPPLQLFRDKTCKMQRSAVLLQLTLRELGTAFKVHTAAFKGILIYCSAFDYSSRLKHLGCQFTPGIRPKT